MRKIIVAFIYLITIACNDATNSSSSNNTDDVVANNTGISAPVTINYTLQNVFKHDTTAYTQGLEWHNNYLIEGTGLRGKSILYQMDNQLKPVGQKLKLTPPYFGEGITIYNGKIYQLTWEEHKVFVYDAITFKKIKEFNWPYEGWGLTHNDSSLIVSTGSSNLYFVDPNTFAIQKTLGVYHQYGYQSMINELEYINGKVFANVYGQNEIIVIDPNTGIITHKMDCSNLLAQAKVQYNPMSIDGGYVLNGIAYKKSSNTLFLTGKCWPVIVEVKLDQY